MRGHTCERRSRRCRLLHAAPKPRQRWLPNNLLLTTAAGFTDFRAIMLSPLPRVYEEGHNCAAVPSEPEPSMIGGDVQVGRVRCLGV